MGGEKYLPYFNADGFVGSPPRGRGKAEETISDDTEVGITPAWAGKRCCCPTAASRSGDHPRTGGEKLP